MSLRAAVVSAFVFAVAVAVAVGAGPARAGATHTLVAPAHGTVSPAELEAATSALQAQLAARADAHQLRLMARETYQKMVDEKRVAGGCADLGCDVKEGVALLVDLVVSSRFVVADGTTTVTVKLVDPRSGIVKATATAEALTVPAALAALAPALDTALLAAFPPADKKSARRSDARPAPFAPSSSAPAVQLNFGFRAGGGRGARAARPADVGPGRQKDCHSTIDCSGGGFCKDRGDGRHVCMNEGDAGDFCSSTIDCGGGLFCKDRGDGFNVCM